MVGKDALVAEIVRDLTHVYRLPVVAIEPMEETQSADTVDLRFADESTAIEAGMLVQDIEHLVTDAELITPVHVRITLNLR